MKRLLVLGAGLVSRPLVRYLLDQADYRVTLADMLVDKAHAMIDGHPDGTAAALPVGDSAQLETLVRQHDLAVSLLPASMHPTVAELCIKHRKHMVTASYVSPQMRALDAPARAAGVTILNEIGVDPGIDHMSAMRVIHDVQNRGGRVASFRSYCGGLPAPEDNDNPWGYKFSWSPRAACTAGKNDAHFLEDGTRVDIPGPELFDHHHTLHVDGVGQLEAYANRDSLGYIDIYGLTGIETMFRGTLRYPGWCVTMKCLVDVGMLAETPVTYPAGTTFARWVARLIKSDSSDNIRRLVADHLKIDVANAVLDRLEWLGVFSEELIPHAGEETTDLDVLATRMSQKMPYEDGERDMIAMVHKFIAAFPDGREELITSTLIDYGQPAGDSSMARTVGLPAAVGATMILSGEINDTGVQIPVKPEIYNPVLDELATMNIRCVEKTE